MPWSDTTTMDQKTQFIADYLREILSITELCELYGISRKTGYKWIGPLSSPGASRSGRILSPSAPNAQPN